MKRAEHFAIGHFDVSYNDGSVELRQDGSSVMWMTFFETGIFTVREHGRGFAGKFPSELGRDDVRARVAFALGNFVRGNFERRAA